MNRKQGSKANPSWSIRKEKGPASSSETTPLKGKLPPKLRPTRTRFWFSC